MWRELVARGLRLVEKGFGVGRNHHGGGRARCVLGLRGHRRSWLGAVAGLAAAVLVLTACSTSTEPVGPSAPTAAAQTSELDSFAIVVNALAPFPGVSDPVVELLMADSGWKRILGGSGVVGVDASPVPTSAPVGEGVDPSGWIGVIIRLAAPAPMTSYPVGSCALPFEQLDGIAMIVDPAAGEVRAVSPYEDKDYERTCFDDFLPG